MSDRSSMEGFVSRTGSSRGVSKSNGEIVAKTHPVMKKSYASNEGQGKKREKRSRDAAQPIAGKRNDAEEE